MNLAYNRWNMGYIKVELTVFDNRWNTVAKESALVTKGEEPLARQNMAIVRKVAYCAGNILIEIIRKAKDEKNQETKQIDFRRGQRRSEYSEDKESKEKEDKKKR